MLPGAWGCPGAGRVPGIAEGEGRRCRPGSRGSGRRRRLRAGLSSRLCPRGERRGAAEPHPRPPTPPGLRGPRSMGTPPAPGDAQQPRGCPGSALRLPPPGRRLSRAPTTPPRLLVPEPGSAGRARTAPRPAGPAPQPFPASPPPSSSPHRQQPRPAGPRQPPPDLRGAGAGAGRRAPDRAGHRAASEPTVSASQGSR